MKQTRHALRGYGAFRRVFALGQRVDGTLVRCAVLVEMSAQTGLRVGYAVSSRAHNAVRRNRLRRLMREAFARERGLLLEEVGEKGRSLSLVFSFKGGPGVDIRRLKLPVVHADIAGICRQLRKKL